MVLRPHKNMYCNLGYLNVKICFNALFSITKIVVELPNIQNNIRPKNMYALQMLGRLVLKLSNVLWNLALLR